MAVLLGIIAALSYALQGSLMAPLYRRLDPLEATSLRGLSLGISMIPLLVVSGEIYGDFYLLIPFLMFSGFVTIFANWFGAIALNYIPIGVSGAVSVSTSTLVSAGISYFIIGEILYSAQIFGIFILLASNISLSIDKKQRESSQWDLRKGILFAVGAGIFGSCGSILTGVSARGGMPMTSGYLWESSIGVAGVFLACARSAMGYGQLRNIALRDFIKIFLCSIATIAGTASFVSAATMASMAVVNAIVLSLTMAFLAVFSYFMHKENLSYGQWLSILLAGAAVLLIKA